MQNARLLIDNDAFILLAGANLLELAVEQLGFELADAYRLPALPYICRSKRQLRELPLVVDRVIAMCEHVPPIVEEPDTAFVQQLIDTPEIDPGEVILYALLVQRPSYLLSSNDKRAMRRIATSKPLQQVRDSVAGRVICMETVFTKLIDAHGVTAIGTAVIPVISIDKALRAIFTPNNILRPGECRAGLDSYYHALVREIGLDFLWQG
jgi:hypothetical protein